MLLKLLQKIQEEIMLLNLLYDATIILIPKLDKDTGEKKKKNKKRTYRPISLMSLGAKILKSLSNKIQQYIESIIYHNHVGFIPLTQGWFNIHKSM